MAEEISAAGIARPELTVPAPGSIAALDPGVPPHARPTAQRASGVCSLSSGGTPCAYLTLPSPGSSAGAAHARCRRRAPRRPFSGARGFVEAFAAGLRPTHSAAPADVVLGRHVHPRRARYVPQVLEALGARAGGGRDHRRGQRAGRPGLPRRQAEAPGLATSEKTAGAGPRAQRRVEGRPRRPGRLHRRRLRPRRRAGSRTSPELFEDPSSRPSPGPPSRTGSRRRHRCASRTKEGITRVPDGAYVRLDAYSTRSPPPAPALAST